MKSNVYQNIAGSMGKMSKSQLKIAKFILENQSTVPFLTVGKLAKMAGVSDATVVRFTTFLGYSGYAEFQQTIQNSVQQQLTTIERLRLSKRIYAGDEKGVYEIFQDDISNINSLMEKLDLNAFQKAVDILIQAKRIYIVANRSAKALGIFFHYYLTMILDYVELIEFVETTSESLYNLNNNDVVVGISFTRYTNSTIQIFSYAKEKGATTIAITDHLLSPLIPYADVSLTAASQMPTFIDSFVAPLSLINALITSVGKAKEEDFYERLNVLEETWRNFGVFYTNETQDIGKKR